MQRSKAGARHLLRIPAIEKLALFWTMEHVARVWAGPNAFPFRATLFDKSAQSNWLVTWHQDTALPVKHRRDAPGWGPWSVKGGVLHAIAPAHALSQIVAIRLHLDDSTADNGPLRVLPRTHAHGVLTHARIQELAASIAPVDCIVSAGSLVVMRPLIIHASSKARSDQPRRVLHIEYAPAHSFDDGIELACG